VFLCMVFLLVILVIAAIVNGVAAFSMVQVSAKIEINLMLEPSIVKIQQKIHKKLEIDLRIKSSLFCSWKIRVYTIANSIIITTQKISLLSKSSLNTNCTRLQLG
jgi:hypothetical protein